MPSMTWSSLAWPCLSTSYLTTSLPYTPSSSCSSLLGANTTLAWLVLPSTFVSILAKLFSGSLLGSISPACICLVGLAINVCFNLGQAVFRLVCGEYFVGLQQPGHADLGDGQGLGDGDLYPEVIHRGGEVDVDLLVVHGGNPLQQLVVRQPEHHLLTALHARRHPEPVGVVGVLLHQAAPLLPLRRYLKQCLGPRPRLHPRHVLHPRHLQ